MDVPVSNKDSDGDTSYMAERRTWTRGQLAPPTRQCKQNPDLVGKGSRLTNQRAGGIGYIKSGGALVILSSSDSDRGTPVTTRAPWRSPQPVHPKYRGAPEDFTATQKAQSH